MSNVVSKAIEKAILVERERCAKVVENMGRSNGRIKIAYKKIAFEIRAANARIGIK